jgi:PAT family beta-lactamase induction signal transducer AmpG
MATAADEPVSLVLTRSGPLRLLTLFLFYFSQGFPIGLTLYAIPAWMATNGASVAQTASVIAAATIPWTFKFLNGFLIDRYTYLPMGRRRVWIIGAQAIMVVALVAAAVVAPDARDVFMISAIAFCASFGAAFQDVGIDSLAVDIMPEDERAKAAGIMFGGQALGIAAATSIGGILIERFGIAAGMLGVALVPLTVMAYGIAIRERDGEKRLPWSRGESHAANLGISAEAWWPLLRQSSKAIFSPVSLLLMPILFMRQVPYGAFEAFHPTLYTQRAGWSMSDYTGLVSTSLLVNGALVLLVGGALIDRIGSRAGIWLAAGGAMVTMVLMGLAQPYWTEDWLLIGFLVLADMFLVLYAAAAIPIYMRLCTPAIAATQFTVYMALSNFGRPAGAWLGSVTAGGGHPEWLYFSAAATMGVVLLIAILVPFPKGGTAEEAVAEHLPHGDGIRPRVD